MHPKLMPITLRKLSEHPLIAQPHSLNCLATAQLTLCHSAPPESVHTRTVNPHGGQAGVCAQ
ncbi:hypothetical protein GCM10009556_047000 [Acrocarpospora pleiomorpha]